MSRLVRYAIVLTFVLTLGLAAAIYVGIVGRTGSPEDIAPVPAKRDAAVAPTGLSVYRRGAGL